MVDTINLLYTPRTGRAVDHTSGPPKIVSHGLPAASMHTLLAAAELFYTVGDGPTLPFRPLFWWHAVFVEKVAVTSVSACLEEERVIPVERSWTRRWRLTRYPVLSQAVVFCSCESRFWMNCVCCFKRLDCEYVEEIFVEIVRGSHCISSLVLNILVFTNWLSAIVFPEEYSRWHISVRHLLPLFGFTCWFFALTFDWTVISSFRLVSSYNRPDSNNSLSV